MNVNAAAALLAGALLLAAPSANAVVIYDESVDGDAPFGNIGTGDGANVVLGLGENTILGLISRIGDADSYVVTVPAELLLHSVVFTFGESISSPEMYLTRTDPGPETILKADPLVINDGGSGSVFESILPLGEGSYRVFPAYFSISSDLLDPSYSWTLTTRQIAEVPEPASFGLLAAGLAGLGSLALRGRKSRRQRLFG